MNLDARCGGPGTPATLQCVMPLFHIVINATLIFVGVVTVILIILAGYRFITAGGDAKQLEGARKAVTFAIIGLLVVLFSFFILNIIGNITGVTCITSFDFNACQ